MGKQNVYLVRGKNVNEDDGRFEYCAEPAEFNVMAKDITQIPDILTKANININILSVELVTEDVIFVDN